MNNIQEFKNNLVLVLSKIKFMTLPVSGLSEIYLSKINGATKTSSVVLLGKRVSQDGKLPVLPSKGALFLLSLAAASRTPSLGVPLHVFSKKRKPARPTKCLCDYLLSIWMLDTIYWNQQISTESERQKCPAPARQCGLVWPVLAVASTC